MSDAVENIEEVEEATGEVTETVETNGDLSSEVGGFETEEAEEVETAETETEDTTAEVEEAEAEEETPARLTFEERADDMGLTVMAPGCYHYSDAYSEVLYRTLQTGIDGIMEECQVPPIALFTKEAGLDGEWQYIGIVSPQYKFEGNDTIFQKVRDGITSVGDAILTERTLMSANRAQIFHEITMRNASQVEQVGDIHPQIIVKNSYDGTKAASISFGFKFNDGDEAIHFASPKRLGSIRQIHIDNSNTTLSAEIGGYVQVFGTNIGDMIAANFDNHITEDDMLASLDLIQKMSGKKRRDAISAAIQESLGEEGIQSWSMTSWQLFLAITKFSAIEKNINARLILEDVAERVLVLPEQMISALAEINS